MLNNFASIMKDPKRFDNHAKQSITRTVMMSDAQTLLHYHGMEQTLNYIANSKQRKVRIKELEDKLQSLSKKTVSISINCLKIPKTWLGIW